jgi:hypothetical protein
MTERAIRTLPEQINTLDPLERTVWERIYTVSREEGTLVLPEAMRRKQDPYIPFLRQQIIRLTNRITGESTLFNDLRARRPLEARQEEAILQEIRKEAGCPFCDPFARTPSDPFGRLEGRYCLTASNLAKYDALHGLIIFREHEPFVTGEAPIRDFLEVAGRWFSCAHQYEPRARFPFFMWNCLWRAGASIIHGHAQVLLTPEPYPAVREWMNNNKAYQTRFGSSYDEDLFRLHDLLGLAGSYGEGQILAHLTPQKEKEVLILAPSIEHLPPLISRVLSTYQRLGVRSFNLAVLQPPLGSTGPVSVRVMDRGDLLSRSSDIGGMELYGGISVVSGDPFRLADALAEEGP